MLSSIKQLYGDKIEALDGEIGYIKDFYIDDLKWVVRYVVVDTGTWLSGRIVLITPDVFTHFDQEGGSRTVNLTRHAIEMSPNFDSQKTVSRKYEEDYFSYYARPGYWGGDGQGVWGLGGFPIIEPRTPPEPQPPIEKVGLPNLRSTKAVKNYLIETKDGKIGYVTDFIIDHKTWSICHLIVQTGRWYSSKEIVISPQQVDHLSYEDSTIFLTPSVTKEAILNSPEYEVKQLN